MSNAFARRVAPVCLALILNLAAPAVAFAAGQEPSVNSDRQAVATAAGTPLSGGELPIQSVSFDFTAETPAANAVEVRAARRAPVSEPATIRRPAALVPLYVSLASLQVMDLTSTLEALGSGAGVEGNPVMRAIVGSPAATVALKAGFTGLAIYSSEKLWKRNRAAAILMMVGMNGAYAAVVAHNYSVQ